MTCLRLLRLPPHGVRLACGLPRSGAVHAKFRFPPIVTSQSDVQSRRLCCCCCLQPVLLSLFLKIDCTTFFSRWGRNGVCSCIAGKVRYTHSGLCLYHDLHTPTRIIFPVFLGMFAWVAPRLWCVSSARRAQSPDSFSSICRGKWGFRFAPGEVLGLLFWCVARERVKVVCDALIAG